MTREHLEFAQIIESWLDTPEADEHPRAVLDRVVAGLDAHPQRRWSWPVRSLGTRRSSFVGVQLVFATVVVLAVVSVVALGSGLLTDGPTPGGPPPPASTSAPILPAADALVGPDVSGSERVTVSGIPMSFSVSEFAGWEAHGRPYISKSTHGPQGAEAIVYWAGFPESLSSDPCPGILGPSIGPTAEDLATAVSVAPGVRLVEGISDVTVGGRPAKRVVVTVQDDLGCDPGYFYTWSPFFYGALWSEALPGDTYTVWIVDVDGQRLFLAAGSREDARPRVPVVEIQAIIDSITFE
jgi:hypothetical protein